MVNASSGAGLLGSVGQGDYSAAEAGILGLTSMAAAELGRHGVQVNAIAPAARTRMTETTFAGDMAAPDDPAAFDAMAPANVSPFVVWLGSAACAGVTGRVFEAEAGRITVMAGRRPGPTADKGARWTPAEAGETARKLLAGAEPPGPNRRGRCTGHPDRSSGPYEVGKTPVREGRQRDGSPERHDGTMIRERHTGTRRGAGSWEFGQGAWRAWRCGRGSARWR